MQGELFTGIGRSAEVDSSGRWRYWLARWWDDRPRWLFVMLNPSTADAEIDDPTIRRCIGFARAGGAGGLEVVNLFALRATNPDELRAVEEREAIGPENERRIADCAWRVQTGGGLVVAAWGKPPFLGATLRAVDVAAQLERYGPVHSLGMTRDGWPRHPLYLPAAARPRPWQLPAL